MMQIIAMTASIPGEAEVFVVCVCVCLLSLFVYLYAFVFIVSPVCVAALKP